MLRTLDLRGQSLDGRQLAEVLPRAELNIERALELVRPIITQVREQGAVALRDFAEEFDCVRPQHLRVPIAALRSAEQNLSPELREAIEISIQNNRKGHQAQLPSAVTTDIVAGGRVTQRWIPVQRVGLYVPGGLTVYPSSVIHNAVAAQVAGVSAIALASPPQADNAGLPHPTILAVCSILGIDEVYAVGGAQAIAMFAHGAQGDISAGDSEILCAPVDVVTGPGNIYVAAAKRAVRGIVGIDSEAGTTEIAIVADEFANPAYVAADLLSQAEHDPAAASVLITHSAKLAMEVTQYLQQQLAQTKHVDRARTALSGVQSGIILTDDISHSIRVANAYGAEHLEIQTQNPREVSKRIINAGAIFLGGYSPVPLGDYMAGSNHVLPTGGTARFNSGLNVMTFIKSVQEIEYGAQAMTELYPHLRALALAEDLPAHAQALGVRVAREEI